MTAVVLGSTFLLLLAGLASASASPKRKCPLLLLKRSASACSSRFFRFFSLRFSLRFFCFASRKATKQAVGHRRGPAAPKRALSGTVQRGDLEVVRRENRAYLGALGRLHHQRLHDSGAGLTPQERALHPLFRK